MTEYKIKGFRSGGFINRDYDMGRVYIDLPISEARQLTCELNRKVYCNSFYRTENGCVALVTENYSELGEPQIIKRHISEKTANRLLDELTKAINDK